MRRLPRTVQVNGERWRVLLKPLARRGLDGLCRPDVREIHIDESLTAEERDETFLHELMHACVREPVSLRVEERLVNRMAPRLLAALESAGWLR
jgi:hypothetical protein